MSWLDREFEASRQEWDALPASVRPVVVRDRWRYPDPVGPLCAGWFTASGVCPHPSCWTMAAERIYLSLKRREA